MIEIVMKKRKKETEAEKDTEKEANHMEKEAGHMEKGEEVDQEIIKDVVVPEVERKVEIEEEEAAKKKIILLLKKQ